MLNLDLYLFNLINGFAGRWAWLDYLEMFFAKYAEYSLWLCLVLFVAINAKKYWKMFVEAGLAAGISKFILAEFIRYLWFRPRPFVALNFIPLINQSADEAAFPSGHASFYFALSTIVYFYNKKVGTAFYAITTLIVLARVFVGVHWPLDILAGALLGILTAWVFNKLFRKYGNKIIKGYNN
jgi:undecaprenyl-diphosphatase